MFTSGLLMFKNNILILKRSPNAEFKPNIWDSVGGHIGEYETAENCILREAKEETGLVVEIVSSGKSYEINNKDGRWIVIPFLLRSNNDKVIVKKDEHSEYKWISPYEINNHECVPDLLLNIELFSKHIKN